MQHKTTKRIFSFILSFCIIFALCPNLLVVVNAASGDVMLNIPGDLIQQCGNQKSSDNLSACQAYALTYCRIILDNKFHSWIEYRTYGQTACNHSVAGYDGFEVNNSPSAQTVLKKYMIVLMQGDPQ